MWEYAAEFSGYVYVAIFCTSLLISWLLNRPSRHRLRFFEESQWDGRIWLMTNGKNNEMIRGEPQGGWQVPEDRSVAGLYLPKAVYGHLPAIMVHDKQTLRQLPLVNHACTGPGVEYFFSEGPVVVPPEGLRITCYTNHLPRPTIGGDVTIGKSASRHWSVPLPAAS